MKSLGVALSLAIVLTSCQPAGAPGKSLGQNAQRGETGPPPPNPPPGDSGGDSGGPPVGWGICSALDFQGVRWPAKLTARERENLALALNVTGSFEGRSGWANLTNNFDGQGVSLGLLQQNLGQGSLQPLLINMRDQASSVWQAVLSPAQRRSLEAMLARWEQAKALEPESASNWDLEISVLDIDAGRKVNLTARNQASVDWAVATLYRNPTQFHPDWQLALEALARTPEYVGQQIEAALALHARATGYADDHGFGLRASYLFFFDIAVQNGGIPSADWQEWQGLVESHPEWVEQDKLVSLLEIRLRRVLPRWREDVRKRKMTIIVGQGVVHGSSRHLPQEYCYQQADRR
ncbi:MAG: hypothetical protein IT288_13045 [Bdellovibrionales bacterium]|nr:hypothetical protein [Bdellovibrionales bacterium]